MEQISFKLAVFEGPMDLLLHLISKHKLNINDIPILELVGQYISYVRQMQDENMEVASEFLEMAARLVYIKTVSLLPRHEEAEKLRMELTGELIEYRDCQLMASKLAEQADGFQCFVREPEELPVDRTYRRLHEPGELIDAYLAAAGKGQRRLPPPVQAFSGIVARTIVSVASRVTFVLRRLWNGGRVQFLSLFTSAKTKSELVATFLAVLELTKDKRLLVDGEGDGMQVELVQEETH